MPETFNEFGDPGHAGIVLSSTKKGGAVRIFLCITLAASVAASPASAGTLDDPGKTAIRTGKEPAGDARPRQGPRGDPRRGESVGDPVEQGLADSVGDLLLYGVVGSVLYGGTASWARVVQEPAPEDGEWEEALSEVAPRRTGEALIPFARVDVSHQFLAGDASALDVRAEAGYAMAAVHVRRTDYREKEPGDDLATTGIHALYRMSFGNHFEMDIGPGALVVERGGSHSGFSFTLPLHFHPSDRYGFEFRPAWSDVAGTAVRDYDVAFLLGWRGLSARAGYRWVRAGSGRFDGPEVGVSVRW